MAAESYRTRAAKLTAAAAALKEESAAAAPFCLVFMTDAARAPKPELVARALPAGSAIILRDYDLPTRRALARRLCAIAQPRGVLILVGEDTALARDVGADGVHLPSWAREPDDRGGLIVTRACHNEDDLRKAADMGADIALLSPVYPTGSHAGAPTLGADEFRRMAAVSPLPVLALGGVDETNAAALAGANVVGLAAISAFLPR